MQSPFESAALSTLPLFLTFDSHVPIADLNASSSAAPWRSQEAFVWGAAPDEAKIKAWRSVAPHAKLSYYMPYSRAPSASKGFGLSFWLREHPDWVLYRCDRKTVAYWDGESAPTGSVPLDFTNPDVIRWQVANQSKFAEAHGYDAMAFDNYGGGARQGANPGQACGVWLCNGTQWAYRFNQSGATFSTRQAAAVRNASIVWLELANHLMAQLTPSLGIIPNLCIDEPSKSRTPPDWAKSADAARVLKASTAVLSERGFTGWGSVRVSEAELLNEYAWMDRLAAAGKAYYSLNEVKGGVNASWAEWAIGAFLVGMQPRHSGLWLGGVQDYGGWSFSSPGLSARIGHPIDRRQQLDAGVWMRNFSGGVALINPRSATARIHVGAGALHGGWRNLTGGTASVDMSGALALGPASACVLLFGTTSSLDVMQMASSADADAVSPPDACFPKPTAAWCNTSIPFSERASLLVAALTLEERIQQLSTFTPSTVPGVARIGLPSFSYHSEGLHGLRNSFDTLSLNATLFPQTTALAASGDMDLVRRMGATMLQEARALSNFAEKRQLGPFGRGSGLFYWSPTMNLGRDPRWGRFQESVSEDPLVNGLYSAAFLQGFQGNDTRYLGVAATCKHMMAYSLEASGNATRHNFSATVSEQDLHETFVPAFQQCVLNGRPAQIMCAYNAINGIPACLRGDLINGLARKRWKFDGLVVSDQDSILDAWNGTRRHPGHFYGHSQENVSALAIRAGCDQNDGVTYAKSLAGAISRDLVATSDIDTALTRVLMQRFRVGAFDPPQLCPFRSIGTAVMDSPAHRALALEAARKGVVLLCNTDAALPLDAGDAHATTVAVIGPLANDTTSLAGGKPDYHPSFTISHLQGIQARMARFGGAPTYAAGCEGVAKCSQGAIKLATHAAAAATTTIIFVGIDGSIEHEGTDRTSIGLPPTQLDMLQRVTAAARGKVIVVLCNGGPLSIGAWRGREVEPIRLDPQLLTPSPSPSFAVHWGRLAPLSSEHGLEQ